MDKLVRAGHAVAMTVPDADKERRLAEVIRVRCSVLVGEANVSRHRGPALEQLRQELE